MGVKEYLRRGKAKPTLRLPPLESAMQRKHQHHFSFSAASAALNSA